MAYITRPLNWDDTDLKGLPIDCVDIKKFFNLAIGRKLYPLIPNKEMITDYEIKEMWMPNRHNYTSFVAAALPNEKVIAFTIVYKNPDTSIASISIIKDPYFHEPGVGTALTATTIEDTLSRGFKVQIHTSVENKRMIAVMHSLSYLSSTVECGYYHGKVDASTQDAYKWTIDDILKKI